MNLRLSHWQVLPPIVAFAALFALLMKWRDVLASLGLPPEGRVGMLGRDLVAVLLWFAGAWVVTRLLTIIFWQGIFGQGGRRHVPRLLVDLVAALVYAIAILSLISLWFEFEIATSALTTSGILVAVLGFALRDTIADIFSGITVNLERPYRIGDWIEVTPGGRVGEVVEISWRTTRLVTQDNISIMVPNGLLSRTQFANFSLPERHFREAVRLRLPPALSPERARQVLSNALKGVSGVLQSPPPEVRIVDIERHAVVYEARFWVPDYRQLTQLRDAAITSLLEHLDKAGIALAQERREITVRRAETRMSRHLTPLELLRRIEMFDVLAEEDVAELSRNLVERRFAPGHAVVRSGDPGGSLFVLAEGLLEVEGKSAEGRKVRLARIEPGGVFGEMSLLTGQPRSADVVCLTEALLYEVDGAALGPILQRRPELALLLSAKVARRVGRNEVAATEQPPPATAAGETGLTSQILARLRALFHLDR
ncbi:MAG: mechanosensitive ion channel family protein [Alphaproteobacteria bacterium]|nr:mechanosensitive ion channel family protein [Alphaproteobacteria bacterium]